MCLNRLEGQEHQGVGPYPEPKQFCELFKTHVDGWVTQKIFNRTTFDVVSIANETRQKSFTITDPLS